MAEKGEKKKDDEGGEETPAAPAPAPSGKKKYLLIGGFVVLLLIVAGIPTLILLMRKSAKTNEQLAADAAQAGGESAALTAEGADDQEEIGEDEERLGMIIPLDTFVVNLAGGKYLRAQIQFEFEGNDIPTRFSTRVVPIRDGIIGILTKKSQADLESPRGKDELKKELKDFVNETLHKEDVKRVYFTQFVVQ